MPEPVRLLHHWENLRSTYWFVPALLAMAALALAGATVSLDRLLHEEFVNGLGWAYGGGPDGAQAVLSTIAGSMITVAGVVFSLTMVTLSLASSQFGPRLLRNFMRDAVNQVVLGTFVATFLFCLVVLRTVSSVEREEFVPHISVSVAVLLSVASIGVLIYFIHHVSASIQVSHVIRAASDELSAAIDRLFPADVGEPSESGAAAVAEQMPKDFAEQGQIVRGRNDGYVQAIDAGQLLEVASEADLVLRLVCAPGQYCIRSTPLVEACPAARVDDRVAARIDAAFVLGRQRTPTQDVTFAASQITEIAVRALSPGINDPFTAVMCIDALTSALRQLLDRRLPSPFRFDSEGSLRVIAHPVRFGAVLDSALGPIFEYGRESSLVSKRVLEALEALTPCARCDDDREAIRRLAERVYAGSRGSLVDAKARQTLDTRRDNFVAALEAPPLSEDADRRQ